MNLKKILRMNWLNAFRAKLKPLNLQIHDSGEFISDQIRRTQSYYEIDMLHFITGNFDCSRVIDIGANIGNHSNYFQRLGSVGWAFEPSLRNFEKLIINASEFDCYNVALADFEGEDKLITFESCLGNNYLSDSFHGVLNDWGTGVKEEKTKVATLDSFNIQSPTFIKIDVEGSELKVLKGAVQTLTKYNPIVCIELHTDESLKNANFPYNRQQINNYFIELGYKKIFSYDETNHFYKKKI
jgi:protein O-GlcNAc transferase